MVPGRKKDIQCRQGKIMKTHIKFITRYNSRKTYSKTFNLFVYPIRFCFRNVRFLDFELNTFYTPCPLQYFRCTIDFKYLPHIHYLIV